MSMRGYFRRFIFFFLVFLTTLIAVGLIATVFEKDGGLTIIEAIMVVFYAVLFAWICLSFWSAIFGFLLCLRRRDPLGITQTVAQDISSFVREGKAAIVMPVYNEDTKRIFAGVKAIYESLNDIGHAALFDFFILSDTRDPDTWVEEEIAWAKLAEELRGKTNLYYRNRIQNTSRKSGNISDFCRRWGGSYDYMIVADADSVIAGETLVRMVQLMDANPKVALIQSPPLPVNRESLFSRILQFASSVYGPVFTSGLAFWHLGDSNYWGHNAVIRLAAWTKHCGLPKLPGKEPFGGEILSHDFVEAALLRKAGWEVWLGYDLEGSFEEIPPTIIDYAKRDRRWCQGNLQHSKLVMTKGIRPLSRLHLMLGIMSYAASPLWLLFILISGVEAYIRSLSSPVYFFGDNIFPVWPVSYRVEMTTVLGVTLTALFLPKILSLLLLLKEPAKLKKFGGLWGASLSVMIETIYSVLLAPAMMFFQSKFVLAILFRFNVGWPPQRRDDHATSLADALIAHGFHVLVGIVGGIVTYQYVPAFFWWLTPVLLGLILSVPISMVTSRVSAGLRAKRWGLFLTPEEVEPSDVVKYLRNAMNVPEEPNPNKLTGFQKAMIDPLVNALHTSMLPPPSQSKRQRFFLESLIFKLIEDGPKSLTPQEKRELLSDSETMKRLHILAWSEPELMHNPCAPSFEAKITLKSPENESSPVAV